MGKSENMGLKNLNSNSEVNNVYLILAKRTSTVAAGN
jgi:hypothetical protein